MTRNEPPWRFALYGSRGRSAARRRRARPMSLVSQRRGRLVGERVEVVARLDLRDDRLHGRGAVLDEHADAGGQRPRIELEQLRVDLAAPAGSVPAADDDARRARHRRRRRAASETDCGASRLVDLDARDLDAGDGRRDARGEDLDTVADAHAPRRDAPGDGAVVAQSLDLVAASAASSGASPPCGRSTSCTGSRNGSRSCSSSSAAGSDSSSSSSAGPSYQGVRSERSTMLSPSSAETGRTCTSSMPSSAVTARTCSAATAAKASSEKPSRSILFTATMTCGTRSSATTARWRRGLLEHALAAVDRARRRRRRSSRR